MFPHQWRRPLLLFPAPLHPPLFIREALRSDMKKPATARNTPRPGDARDPEFNFSCMDPLRDALAHALR